MTRMSVLAVFLGLILSFLSGVITVKYRSFPYAHLEWMKNFAVARIDLNPLSSQSDYYYDKKSFFEQHGQAAYDVVMIGDSITDAAEWQDLFPHLRIANRGIGGDTTFGVIQRLDSICSAGATKAFIMIGVNDFSRGYSVAAVTNNYEKIIDQLRACGIEPYIQSTMLTSRNKKELNLKINQLNQLLQGMAKEKKLAFIDLNSGLTNTGLLSDQFTRDGLHLNGDGYGVWREALRSYMEQ